MVFKLSHYSMGFLELFEPGRVELRGSGTLVRVGNTYGILTAGHVWRTLCKLSRVGIYLYPARKSEIQAITEEVRLLDAVAFDNHHEDDLGPDIAFIRIRSDKVVSIEKHGTFLNLEKDQQRAHTEAPAGSKVLDVVAGGVEALGQKINIRDDRMLIVQGSLANMGSTRPISDGRDGFDRLEFTPEPDEDFVIPSSYGGMSGGGCFRLYFLKEDEGEMQLVHWHLLGVAFFETKLGNKADKIICHGRRSIFDKLIPAVRAKWSD